MATDTDVYVTVPLEPPDLIPGLDDFDEELFDLCRKDDYRGLYRVLVRRVAESIAENWPQRLTGYGMEVR